MRHSMIIGVFLALFVAIAFLGIVSAAEEIVNGEKFNIPDGFVKNQELSSVSKSSYGTDEIAYYEKDLDSISITVSKLNGGAPNLPTDEGFKNKNISGIDGKYREDKDGEEFVYNDGDMSIVIWLPHDCSVSFDDILINSPAEKDSGFSFNFG